MGTSDDIKYLEAERKKIWEEISQLHQQVEKIPELREKILQQTPEHIQLILNKLVDVDNLYSKISTIHIAASESNEQINTFFLTMQNNLKLSNEIANNLQQADKQSKEFLLSIEDNNTISTNVLTKSKQIEKDLDALILEINAKKQKLEDVNTLHESSEELKQKIDLAYTNIDQKYKEINKLHLQILGYDKKDENDKDIRVEGLKDELERAYLQLSKDLTQLHEEIKTSISNSQINSINVKEHWENEHNTLKTEIEKLLPGALTAGLSQAYEEKKTTETISMKESTESFRQAIRGLVTISLIPFAISIVLLLQGISLEDTILKLPRMVMAIFPLYIPILWMAYSTSKKVNLSKRLIEEYSHKAALSKTFEGLSRQVNNIKDSQEKDELKAKLLYNLLEVSAENPGKLIYDYNNADHPLMDALDKSVKLSEAVTKLANFPGMSKLTNILVEKEKKIKEEIHEKADEGFDVSGEVKVSAKESI